MNWNNCRKMCVLAVLSAVLIFGVAANAGYDPVDVRTVNFNPPMDFGMVSDGLLFPGDPIIGREVIQVRITWDVIVADNYDASNIIASASLPIDTHSGIFANVDLNGTTLGWFGSGYFHHYEETNRFNGFFGQAGTHFSSQALGLPYGAAEITASSIEVDYLVPEPATMSLLALGGLSLLRRRKRI